MTALVSIAHDPTGALVEPAKRAIGLLREIYDDIVVNVTDTSEELICTLKSSAIISPAEGVGKARRLALKHGLKLEADHFHYCDFDRVLYWVLHYPNELIEISQNITEFPFTIIGRTKTAFDSHPEFQRKTEREGNIQFSMAYGWADNHLDILAGSRGVSREIAQRILSSSVEMGAAGIDTEWPFIAGGCWYTEVDGLAYESSYLGIEKSPVDEAILRTANLIEVLEAIRNRQR